MNIIATSIVALFASVALANPPAATKPAATTTAPAATKPADAATTAKVDCKDKKNAEKAECKNPTKTH